MLRTLRAEGFDGEIAFIHYARAAEEACYRDELAAMPGVKVLHGYTRVRAGSDLDGRFGPEHLAAAMPDPETRCSSAAHLLWSRPCANTARTCCSESFVPPVFDVPAEASGGRVTFADSGVEVDDDGRPLLEQAEAAGLTPESGCRMGICHSCTRRKTRGAVRNLITGAVSSAEQEDVQICVSAPVGDVDIAL